MQWESQKMPCSTWSPGPAHWAAKGHPPQHLQTLEIPTQTLAEPEKAPFPQQWLAPISCGLWGSCSPSQPLLAVQWVLQLNSSAGQWGHLQVLPWKAKSCQQQAGAGFGWRPCAQTVMDSRQPTGSPQRFFGSWAARGSGPKATSVRRRVVGPGGEG